MKLNQIIALVAGKKTRIQKFLTGIHHGWKEERLKGISRTYSPKDEEGEQLPPEVRSVQIRVNQSINSIREQMADFINIVASQEIANTTAKANLIIDEEMEIVRDVPVTVLLFLEKQLVDLRTLIEHLPTLPRDKEWTYDKNRNCYVSTIEQTNRTKKVPKPIVKYPATTEHPAQTEMVMDDIIVGQWSTTHFSGALPESELEIMLTRVTKLLEAVKVARELANCIDIDLEKDLGKTVLNYIFQN